MLFGIFDKIDSNDKFEMISISNYDFKKLKQKIFWTGVFSVPVLSFTAWLLNTIFS